MTGPIYLRRLVESDFDARYLAWFRDPSVTRFLDASGISREEAIDHLRRGQDGRSWRLYAICETGSNRHVGNLKIGPINWKHAVSDLVTVIGERSVWGRGYARQAIRLGIRIAFDEMNIRKLSASIDSLNVGSLKAYTAAGFVIEGVLPDHFVHRRDGGVVLSDKVFVGCFNSSFDIAKAQDGT